MHRPQPGDAVRLDSDTYYGAPRGAIAIIDSTHYDWDGQCLLVFKASAFRGPSSKYAPDQTEFVSCSGGPCPLVPMDTLQLVGERATRFWRWQDVPRADGGIDYTRTVPLWSWDGLTALERAERAVGYPTRHD